MATSFRCVLATLAVALLLPAPFAAAAPRTAHHSTSTPSALELAVLAQLNQVRAAHGLVALKLSGGLTAASVQHSREMGADGYFDHSSADGTAFWRRIQ